MLRVWRDARDGKPATKSCGDPARYRPLPSQRNHLLGALGGLGALHVPPISAGSGAFQRDQTLRSKGASLLAPPSQLPWPRPLQPRFPASSGSRDGHYPRSQRPRHNTVDSTLVGFPVFLFIWKYSWCTVLCQFQNTGYWSPKHMHIHTCGFSDSLAG